MPYFLSSLFCLKTNFQNLLKLLRNVGLPSNTLWQVPKSSLSHMKLIPLLRMNLYPTDCSFIFPRIYFFLDSKQLFPHHSLPKKFFSSQRLCKMDILPHAICFFSTGFILCALIICLAVFLLVPSTLIIEYNWIKKWRALSTADVKENLSERKDEEDFWS